MTLPNTLIIGAQKAGSSWLDRNIRKHPNVFTPGKEIHFFNLEHNYRRGLRWYAAHFEQAKSAKIVAEKTPNYLWITQKNVVSRFGTHLAGTHLNLQSALPDAKLIVVLRNPVERAISAVNHYRTHGQLSPLVNVDKLFDRLCEGEPDQFGILSMGEYYRHLQAYLGCYPAEQILVIEFERDIVANPQAGLEKVCQFLEIEDSFKFPNVRQQSNAFRSLSYGSALAIHTFPGSSVLRKITAAIPTPLLGPTITKTRPTHRVVERLYNYFDADNEKLFELLNCRFESWKSA